MYIICPIITVLVIRHHMFSTTYILVLVLLFILGYPLAMGCGVDTNIDDKKIRGKYIFIY